MCHERQLLFFFIYLGTYPVTERINPVDVVSSAQNITYSLSVLWIRIGPYSMVSPDPDPGGQKIETVNKFHLLKCWMFSFEG
jgi:hypothetical protein